MRLDEIIRIAIEAVMEALSDYGIEVRDPLA